MWRTISYFISFDFGVKYFHEVHPSINSSQEKNVFSVKDKLLWFCQGLLCMCVFECTVCMWVHVHVSQLVQPSQFARGIVLLPVSLSLSKGGPSPVLTAVPHIGVPPFSSGGFLWRRLTVEALPPQALRRLPPVPAVAPTDGAVVHLHFNASWDDCGSSEAIWTCHMGKRRRF